MNDIGNMSLCMYVVITGGWFPAINCWFSSLEGVCQFTLPQSGRAVSTILILVELKDEDGILQF